MATITGLKFYLEKVDEAPDFVATAGVKTGVASGPPSSIAGAVSAYKVISSDSLPAYESPAWVTFTFDDPLTITENGFYGIYLEVSGMFIGDRLRVYEASDWSEAAASPYDGQEKALRGGSGTYSILYGDPGFAYEILTTVITGNGATTPSANYHTFQVISGAGIGSFLEAIPLPEKATTPAPANAATDVTLDQATVTWEDGGGATSYDVYYGESAAVVAAADNTDETGIYLGNQAGLSLTVTGITSGSPYSYLVARYWRIDSVNASGTTTGDAWSFTTLRFSPPVLTYYSHLTGQRYKRLIDTDGNYGDHPAGGGGAGVEDTDFVYLAATYSPNFMSTSRKLVGASNDKIWVEDT